MGEATRPVHLTCEGIAVAEHGLGSIYISCIWGLRETAVVNWILHRQTASAAVYRTPLNP